MMSSLAREEEEGEEGGRAETATTGIDRFPIRCEFLISPGKSRERRRCEASEIKLALLIS